VTERRILGELDLDPAMNDPGDDDGWFGSAQVEVAEPLVTPEHDDPPLGYPRYPAEYDPEDPDPRPDPEPEAEPDETPWSGILAPRIGRPAVPPTPSWESKSWESKLSNSGAWDFKVSATSPWYRSKRVLSAAAAVAALTLALTGIVLFTRGSSGGDEESTPVTPSNPGTASSVPSSPVPALSTEIAPPPPLPPPPPPPPSADQITAPPTRGYTPPRRSAPSQSDMPEVGVTRTPITRAPFSATPPPPRTPDRNSSTPGDGPKGGWGRW
jgi:hypothetical protein